MSSFKSCSLVNKGNVTAARWMFLFETPESCFYFEGFTTCVSFLSRSLIARHALRYFTCVVDSSVLLVVVILDFACFILLSLTQHVSLSIRCQAVRKTLVLSLL